VQSEVRVIEPTVEWTVRCVTELRFRDMTEWGEVLQVITEPGSLSVWVDTPMRRLVFQRDEMVRVVGAEQWT
jgi:hypothetical protein